MFHKPHRTVAAFVLAGAALVALHGASANAANLATSCNPCTFADATGDGNGAPDVRTVTVSNDAVGQIAFQIATDQPSLGGSAALFVFIDADQQQSTGFGNDGIDYVLTLDSSGPGIAQWTGSTLVGASAPSLRASYTNGVATISINRSDLGGTSGFNFYVASVADELSQNADQRDDAPDTGTWNYQLTSTLQLSVAYMVAAKTVKAGGMYAVGMLVQRSDTGGFVGSDGQVQCTATLSGKPLVNGVNTIVSITYHGLKVTGPVCAWQIPRGTRGRRLHGTITVSYQGAQVARTFSATTR